MLRQTTSVCVEALLRELRASCASGGAAAAALVAHSDVHYEVVDDFDVDSATLSSSSACAPRAGDAEAAQEHVHAVVRRTEYNEISQLSDTQTQTSAGYHDITQLSACSGLHTGARRPPSTLVRTASSHRSRRPTSQLWSLAPPMAPKPRRSVKTIDTDLLSDHLQAVELGTQQKSPFDAQEVSRMAELVPGRCRPRSASPSCSASTPRRRRSPARCGRSRSQHSSSRSAYSGARRPLRRAASRPRTPPVERAPRRTPPSPRRPHSPSRTRRHSSAPREPQPRRIPPPQRSKDYVVSLLRGNMCSSQYAKVMYAMHTHFLHEGKRLRTREVASDAGPTIQIRGYGIF